MQGKLNFINPLKRNFFIPAVVFTVGFWLIPVTQLKNLSLMPGDLGDARLNNYFLENIYQFFAGKSESLWHLPFFYDYPYVIGFSDNLFGTAPIYLVARYLLKEYDTAFQVWFLFGYLANYLAAYFGLRKLDLKILSSAIGSFIFTFAIPATAHAGHSQLHYRFGIPLTITFFIIFLKTGQWRNLVISFGWLTWQFYAGIYMGFFALLILASIGVTFLILFPFGETSVKQKLNKFTNAWNMETLKSKIQLLTGVIGLSSLLILLFYPYVQVTKIYGFVRTWDEIVPMLPRVQSYFLSDSSRIWGSTSSKIGEWLPIREEHQMFLGLIPLLLMLIGIAYILKTKTDLAIPFLFFGALILPVLVTVYVKDFSIWLWLHNLPLASAIRAVTRLDQAILFGVSFFAAYAINYLIGKGKLGIAFVVVVVFPLLLIESKMTTMKTSSKASWRERYAAVESITPKDLKSDSVLFYSQRGGLYLEDEIDAMWVSLEKGVKTINGYSGSFPPAYNSNYKQDCGEVPRQVAEYVKFTEGSLDLVRYRSIMKRIVPVGFEGCMPEWEISPP